MQDISKTSRTELIKYTEGVTRKRNYYYTKISFELNGMPFSLAFKVDTGAAYTIVGLDLLKSTSMVESIKKNAIIVNSDIVDASGTDLEAYGYVVKNFKLTEDIIIPKMLIYFSDKIGSKALLGFDILSLFDIVYLKTHKEFWLHNYKGIVDKCMEYMKKIGKDYLNTDNIAFISNDNTNEINAIDSIDMIDNSIVIIDDNGNVLSDEDLVKIM